MALRYAIRWDDEIGQVMEDLPGEAQAALARRFELLEARPYGSGPPRRGEQVVTFGGDGEEGDGLLGCWVDEDKQEIWITRISWWPYEPNDMA